MTRRSSMFTRAAWLFVAAACGPVQTATDYDTDGGEGGVAYASERDACNTMIDCITAVTPSSAAAALEGYGPTSVCWLDARSASTCNTACTEATRELLEAFPEEDACAIDGWDYLAFEDGRYDIEIQQDDTCIRAPDGAFTYFELDRNNLSDFDVAFQGLGVTAECETTSSRLRASVCPTSSSWSGSNLARPSTS